TYKRPQGHGIRVDDGFEQGMAIPFYYDPMIAKMICHDETRERAIEKMIRAIEEYEITGVETTLGFCHFVMKHEAFRSGNFSTKFVEQYFKPEVLKPESSAEEEMIASALATHLLTSSKQIQMSTSEHVGIAVSKWKTNRLA
ncbi:MAG TPA: biotin carboxylase, partial [Cytophagales bacterium]|nr:biotin carboxylase [Cytophagales bacterium]